MIKIYIGGTFDLFHAGHIKLFKRAKKMADIVCVSLNTDDFIKQFKGKAPIMTLKERTEVIKACKYVDEVVINIGGADSKPAILRAKPDYIIVGDDYNYERYLKQMSFTQEWLDKHNIELKFVPYTKGISTSDIKKRIIKQNEISNR